MKIVKFGFVAIIMATVTLSGSPVISGNLTINNGLGGNFALGQSWSLELTSPYPETTFTYCEIRNLVQTCIPNFATTDTKGAWKISGQMGPETTGTWVQWFVFPSGATSNRIAFTVNTPDKGTLTINNSVGGTFTVGQAWTLSSSGRTPNSLIEHCAIYESGTPSCRLIGTTDSKGSWSLSGTFPKEVEGGWTEWLRFTSGEETNPIAFAVGTPIQYALSGLDLGPFIPGQNPDTGSVVSEQQLEERISRIAPYTLWLRSYGSTNGLENFGKVAKRHGLKTALGAWLSTDNQANNLEIQSLIAAYKAGYGNMLIPGSETLLRKDLTPAQLISYLKQVKQAVPTATVATSDTFSSLYDNPDVVAASDVVLFNSYPYWEGKDINQAMVSINIQYDQLKTKYPQKEIIVSESGWPSGGNTIGSAVPSPQNSATFFLNFVSWARSKNVKYFYFEAYDELWKALNEGPQGAHWGIWDPYGTMKPGMINVFQGQTVADNWTDPLAGIPGGSGTPTIQFTAIPARFTTDNLKGIVLHVKTADYKVAVYIRVQGGWWTKPYYDSPATLINPNGTFETDITTGGVDSEADSIAAYVVPATYSIPLATGGALPTVTGFVASLVVTR